MALVQRKLWGGSSRTLPKNPSACKHGARPWHSRDWSLPQCDVGSSKRNGRWKERDEAGGFPPERRERMAIAGNKACWKCVGLFLGFVFNFNEAVLPKHLLHSPREKRLVSLDQQWIFWQSYLLEAQTSFTQLDLHTYGNCSKPFYLLMYPFPISHSSGPPHSIRSFLFCLSCPFIFHFSFLLTFSYDNLLTYLAFTYKSQVLFVEDTLMSVTWKMWEN